MVGREKVSLGDKKKPFVYTQCGGGGAAAAFITVFDFGVFPSLLQISTFNLYITDVESFVLPNTLNFKNQLLTQQ